MSITIGKQGAGPLTTDRVPKAFESGDDLSSTIVGLSALAKELHSPSPRKLLDRSLAAIESHLFQLADKLREGHRSKGFSALLVDDCSARFLGIFLAKVIDPARQLPISFIKITDAVRYAESTNITAELGKRVERNELGAHPLFVTEFIQTGQYCQYLVETLADLGIAPSVAVLSYDMCGSLDRNIFDIIRRAGAVRIFAQSPAAGLLSAVYNNSALNGVVAHDQSKDAEWRWQRIRSWKSMEYEGVQGVGSPSLRHELVSYSRKRLAEMVTKYKQSRSRRGTT